MSTKQTAVPERHNMERFRTKLSEARRKNVDGYWYLPRLAIERITDSYTISQIILENSFLSEEKDPTFAHALRGSHEQNIFNQARVTFAISCYTKPPCLRHIISLIGYGIKRGSVVDNCLPFTKDELRGCGLDVEHTDAFLSTQWHFLTPTIRLGAFVPSEYDREVVLPFWLDRAEQMLAQDTGAFGTVKEICIEEGHQLEPIYNGRVIYPFLALSTES